MSKYEPDTEIRVLSFPGSHPDDLSSIVGCHGKVIAPREAQPEEFTRAVFDLPRDSRDGEWYFRDDEIEAVSE